MHKVKCSGMKIEACEETRSSFHRCTKTFNLNDEQWARANAPGGSVNDFCKGHKCSCKTTW